MVVSFRANKLTRSKPWQPGFEGTMELGVETVDDPYALEPGDKLSVIKNFKADILSRLKGRDFIDEWQYKAGQRFLGLMERAGVTGARAMDWTIERVDGNPDPDGAILTHVEALDELSDIRRHIGRKDYDLIYGVLGKIFSFNQWPEGDRKYAGRRFRDALQELARYWGIIS